ncbi:hypothetical protein J7373_08865 [Xanthomonas sp. A2111]|uniref:Secreted protein n=1 Tax=Xanthomonas hawaiiensis TaxID=3003247 RepID=A0ABU2I4M5_9XANT|nr:hypothetical protein [Xanthomonas sp. A2111]MBO9828354.1 hypothetical protein [Xanthomonas sp. A2111]MDS9993101.1 hypothetical protein [Xanthomonas sp. A2111]
MPPLLLLLALASPAAPGAVPTHTTATPMPTDCRAAAATPADAGVCDPRRGLLHLAYRAGRVVLQLPGRAPTVLETIPRAYAPELIGTEHAIRLLPTALQPYLGHDRLLYLSVRRSSPGDGHGYCGAGAEMALTVVDLHGTPSILARVPVSSCLDNIDLDAPDLGDLHPYTVRDGRLRIRFSTYAGHDSAGPVEAVLAPDLRTLTFVP